MVEIQSTIGVHEEHYILADLLSLEDCKTYKSLDQHVHPDWRSDVPSTRNHDAFPKVDHCRGRSTVQSIHLSLCCTDAVLHHLQGW